MRQCEGIYEAVGLYGWGFMRFVKGLVGFCGGAVGVSAPVAEDRDGTVKDMVLQFSASPFG